MQWLKAVWGHVRDNKLNQVLLNKLNREFYDLTFGTQNVPPITHKMSKNWMHLNYKQYKQCLWDTGDMALQNVTVEEQWTAVAEFLANPIAKYITLAENIFGYFGT